MFDDKIRAMEQDERTKGLIAALLTPFFLGMSPIFGKMALVSGADPFTVAAVRMALVVLLLWGVYSLFWRSYIYIFPAGLIACIVVGVTNGIGSIFYYSGLARLDASIAQILNANYLLFVVLLTRLGGSQIGRRTLLRTIVALLGTFFITGGLEGEATWMGVGFMTGNALLFAGTIVMSQRILYEMPSKTATLYIMTAMAGTVILARLIYNIRWTPMSQETLGALMALAATTALSRLLLFAGVKRIGGVRTILMAIAESAVAVSLSYLVLDERLLPIQWLGVGVMLLSFVLPTDDIKNPHGVQLGLPIPNVTLLRSQQIAFRKAFVAPDERLTTAEIHQLDGGEGEAMTPQEIENLRRMLGEDAVKQLTGE